MNHYVPIEVASEQTGISRRKLNSMMKAGVIRFKETTNIVTRKEVTLVRLQDIAEAGAHSSLAFIEIARAGDDYPVSLRQVRSLVATGRLRWIARNSRKLVCADDLKQYVSGNRSPQKAKAADKTSEE